MTPLEEFINFPFDDPRLQQRFVVEVTYAHKVLHEMGIYLSKPLDNDLGVLKSTLCKYIEYMGRLGTIQNNMASWERLALNQSIKRRKIEYDYKTEKELHEMAVEDCRGIIELARLPEIFYKTMKESKAMIKSIINTEIGGGYGHD